MVDIIETEEILTGLQDSNPNKRNELIDKLTQLRNSDIVTYLISLLKQDIIHWQVKEGACKALGRIGDKSATEALIASLDDDNEIVRYQAVNALGKLGDKRAVPKLLSILQKKEEQLVRSEAVKALGMIGDPSALKIVLNILKKEEDRFIKYHSVTTLGKLGDKRALKELQKIAKTSTDDRLVLRALEAIENIEKRMNKPKVVAG
ncbi:MAG: HEAT repeat domain-containing protein [Candidatus Heimdallarchaeota archaeon]